MTCGGPLLNTKRGRGSSGFKPNASVAAPLAGPVARAGRFAARERTGARVSTKVGIRTDAPGQFRCSSYPRRLDLSVTGVPRTRALPDTVTGLAGLSPFVFLLTRLSDHPDVRRLRTKPFTARRLRGRREPWPAYLTRPPRSGSCASSGPRRWVARAGSA